MVRYKDSIPPEIKSATKSLVEEESTIPQTVSSSTPVISNLIDKRFRDIQILDKISLQIVQVTSIKNMLNPNNQSKVSTSTDEVRYEIYSLITIITLIFLLHNS